MSRGVILKTFREVWITTLIFAGAMLLAEGLLAYVIPMLFSEYTEQMLQLAEQLLQLDFVKKIGIGLVGVELEGDFGPETIRTFAWFHIIVLAILWAFCITYCTRMPAGEIDRGTVDILLSWPASRTRIFLCDALMWLAAGMLVVLCGWLGNHLGGRSAGKEYHIPTASSVAIVANMYSMFLAIGGMVYLVSAVSDRRGSAVGVALGVLLASFFLNFLAQFWPPAKSVGFLSVLEYYRPLQIVREGSWPIRDMLVLIVAGAVFYIIALIVFARRDIRTV